MSVAKASQDCGHVTITSPSHLPDAVECRSMQSLRVLWMDKQGLELVLYVYHHQSSSSSSIVVVIIIINIIIIIIIYYRIRFTRLLIYPALPTFAPLGPWL